MAVSKFYPTSFDPPKGSKVKYFNFAITKAIVNIFAEILHEGRAAIDIKHIKRNFEFEGLSWLGGLRGWGGGQN